ncbi:MFS transporter [Chloroflexota bacterium]
MGNGTGSSANKRVTLIITSIAAFISASMFSSVNIALPTIGEEFAAEAVLLGWVANATLLTTTVFLLPFGRLADIYGRKKIFLYGILLFVVASFLCAIAESTILLIYFRGLQGVAGAMSFGTSVAILISVFPAEERGRALGINVGAVYLGLSLGPVLGGLMTQYFGWRSIFYLSAFLGFLVVVLVFWRLRGEWTGARGEKFDIFSSILFSISLAAIMYGFTVLPDIKGLLFILFGGPGMLVFVLWDAKVESPVLNVALFKKNKAFVFSNLATLINYSASFAMAFLLSFYLQYIMGFSPQAAGLIFVVHSAVMAVIAPFAGRLSDRVEPRKIASSGMAFSCVALLLFAFLTEETALAFIIGSLVIFGLGAGLFSSPNTNAVMSSVEKKFFGVASGTNATMRSCGMVFSIGIVMILFSIYLGEVQITPEYYPAFLASMKVAFLIFAALCFGGVFLQLAGRNITEINHNSGT